MSEKETKDSTTNKNHQVKELEKQIRILEIENAYLKELRRRGDIRHYELPLERSRLVEDN